MLLDSIDIPFFITSLLPIPEGKELIVPIAG